MNYISVLFAIGYLTLSPIIVVYSGIVYKVYGYLELGTRNYKKRVTENGVRS